MPRRPQKGLCRARCPGLPMRMVISIRGKRRPRGSVRSRSRGREGVSSSGYRGREQHTLKASPLPVKSISAREQQVSAPVHVSSNGATHRLPPRARSTTLRRLRTSSSSCRFGNSRTGRVVGCNERGRDVVAIESGGPVREAAINNRLVSDDQASIQGQSHPSHKLSEPRTPSQAARDGACVIGPADSAVTSRHLFPQTI